MLALKSVIIPSVSLRDAEQFLKELKVFKKEQTDQQHNQEFSLLRPSFRRSFNQLPFLVHEPVDTLPYVLSVVLQILLVRQDLIAFLH